MNERRFYTGWVMPQSALFSQQNVLRALVVGFTMVVLLVVAAAYVGYQGSRSIHENAQELVRGHFITSGRGAELETLIEQQSQALLDELEWVLGTCLILALSCAGITIWSTRRAFQRLEWQAEELNRVSWQMLQDQEVVARRFSHEMHDELGQSLTGLRGMLKQLKPTEFEQRRQECVAVLDEALTGVRELSQLLRPVILDDFGLDAGMRWLTERFSERTGIVADYQSNYPKRLSDEQETHLFRIAQEALTNIARHSGAAHAALCLNAGPHTVTLSIEDDGKGLPEPRSQQMSLGMVGMRARARQIGGDLRTGSGNSGGLRLEVMAPARYADENEHVSKPEDTHPLSR